MAEVKTPEAGPTEEPPTAAAGPPELTDEALTQLAQQRFRERARRVYAVMEKERIMFNVETILRTGRVPISRLFPVELPPGQRVETEDI